MAFRKRSGIGRKRINISELSELPPDSYSSCPLVEVCGDREVFISGCRSLLEYTEERIAFDSSLGTVTVMGKNMCLSGFAEKRMTVTGKISGVTIGDRSTEA